MGFLHTANVVKSLAAFPCAQPSTIIILETFVPAVVPALLEWVSFGCRDIMKFRLGKGVPCGRAMKAQVAKAVPPAFADLVSNTMKWEHRFSYAGQMFLLADLASDTIARWDTLAYQVSGCPNVTNVATWDISYSAPEALAANVDTVIGGAITNANNAHGIAWPTGAIVPPGWYLQCHFRIQAQALFAHESPGLTTWLRREDLGGYDFEANRYPAGYAGVRTTGQITLTTQNTNDRRSALYTMHAIADKLSLTTALDSTWQCSEFPPSDWSLSPLGCLRNIGVTEVADPLNRNPKPTYPGIVSKFLGENAPKPVRGPPGGKPRTKK